MHTITNMNSADASSTMICTLFCALLCVGIINVSSGTASRKCERPSLRKEWRALGYDGQKAYIDAVKASIFHFHGVTLLKLPVSSVCRIFLMRPWSRQVLPLVYLPFSQIVPSMMMLSMCGSDYHCRINHFSHCLCRHMDATNRFIPFFGDYRQITLTAAFSVHLTGRFLPWHRLYLHTMEGLLRNKCGYTGHMTYWDWTIGRSGRRESQKWSLIRCSLRFTRHGALSSFQCWSYSRFWDISRCQHQLLPYWRGLSWYDPCLSYSSSHSTEFLFDGAFSQVIDRHFISDVELPRSALGNSSPSMAVSIST